MDEPIEEPPALAWMFGDPDQRAAWRRYWVDDTIFGALSTLTHWLFKLLPVDACSAVGAWIGQELGRRRYRVGTRRARDNYARLRPDVTDPAEVAAAVERMWRNLGRSMVEFSAMPRLHRGDRVAVVGAEHLAAARATNRPRIFLLLHLGAWELIGPMLLREGESGRHMYQPLTNRFERRIAERVRRPFRHLMISPGTGEARQAIRALSRDKGVIILGVDEYIRGRVQAPAFGREISPQANLFSAARLALMSDAVLAPAYVLRTKGAHFVLHIGAPFRPVRTGDRAADLQATAAAIDGAITPIVVANLDQWFMLHHLRFDASSP
jgi:KDO2-lipid IV(A) lauroyltransferase